METLAAIFSMASDASNASRQINTETVLALIASGLSVLSQAKKIWNSKARIQCAVQKMGKNIRRRLSRGFNKENSMKRFAENIAQEFSPCPA